MNLLFNFILSLPGISYLGETFKVTSVAHFVTRSTGMFLALYIRIIGTSSITFKSILCPVDIVMILILFISSASEHLMIPSLTDISVVFPHHNICIITL